MTHDEEDHEREEDIPENFTNFRVSIPFTSGR